MSKGDVNVAADVIHAESDPTQAGRAVLAVREVMRAYNIVSKKLGRDNGVSGAQLEVLEILRENPGLSASDLACRSATDQSTASVVVKRLTDSGLVDRRQQDGDRRRTELALTPAGQALLAKAPPSVTTRLREAFMRLANGERATLTVLLERWLGLAGLRRI